MKPEIKQFKPFIVQGFQVRTTNAAEQTPEAKIGALWQRYFSTPGAAVAGIYGVYSGYESDWNGAFDVTAGVKAASSALPGMKTVQVQAGQYLVFTSKGVMPQAVIAGWMQVWQHFNAPRSDVQRLYATDFEEYLAPDEVAICIGVRELG